MDDRLLQGLTSVEKTVGAQLRRHIEREPEADALITSNGRLSYKELFAQVQSMAGRLVSAGLRPGDRMALILDDGAPLVISLYAAAWMGAIILPLTPSHGTAEIVAQLALAQPRLVLAEARLIKELSAALKSQDLSPDLFTVGEQIAGAQQLDALPEAAVEEYGQPDAPFLLLPVPAAKRRRLIVHHQCAVLVSCAGVNSRIAATSADRFMPLIPVGNIFGISVAFCALAAGGALVICGSRQPEAQSALAAEHGVTVCFGVPAMLAALLDADCRRFGLRSLRCAFLGGAPVAADLVRRLALDLNCSAVIGYGLAETIWLTATPIEAPIGRRAETVGSPLPGVDLRIVDEHGREVQQGTTGELICRSPSMMIGYDGFPELTAERFDSEGWFHTRDLAVFDDDGMLRIAGRLRPFIIRGSEKIAPSEIEAVLARHPSIAQVAVFGVPDAQLTERTSACVVFQKGSSLDEAALAAYCSEHLPPFKIPDYFVPLPSLPRTARGDIDWTELREQVRLVLEHMAERRRSEEERLRLLEEVSRMQEAILALSTPLIPITDDIVIMPLIGSMDERRAQQLIETLLSGVQSSKARYAIVDITGVPVVDTQVANALIQAAQAVRLLGTRMIITGIRPEVAQTLVGLGVNLAEIVTHRTLQSGIAAVLGEAGLSGRGRPAGVLR